MIGEGRGGRTLAQALLESERKVDSLEEELDGSRRRRDKIFQSRPREWVEERLTQLAEEDTWGASNWLSVALPADQDRCGPLTTMKERHRVSGFTTIEMVIVLSLFGFVLVSLVGLHLVALSAGTAAETSSIAANLARARMEALLALPRETLREQNNTEESHQIPPGGRTYMVHTTVIPPDAARLDLTVTVSWQLAVGSACAGAGSTANCQGTQVTYSRTIQTRVQAPEQPPAQP